MGLLRVRHDWATSLSLFTFMHWRRKWQLIPVFLPGESQGQGAWWAAVYAVAQSRTRLKRFSSSSSSSSDYITSSWRLAGGALFLPPSDAYVRSFLYILCTLIKLYYSVWSSLVSGPGLNSSPLGAKNPSVFAWFNNNLSSWGLVRDPSGQGKDAWSSSSLFS